MNNEEIIIFNIEPVEINQRYDNLIYIENFLIYMIIFIINNILLLYFFLYSDCNDQNYYIYIYIFIINILLCHL